MPDTAQPTPESPTPRLLRWLPGAFLVGVLGLGAVATLMQPATRTWPTRGALADGTAQATYEHKNFDPSVPWRTASLNAWGRLGYSLFGEAREGALVGQGGWLYTTEEFQTGPEDAAHIAANLAYVRHVRDELARSGTRLVVALIPAKARVYPAHLGRYQRPAAWDGVYQSFRDSLEKAGIPAPDLETALRHAAKPAASQAVFLRTDTHWTPLGAVMAAQAVAPVVLALAPDLPKASYSTAARPQRPRPGDLLRFLPGTGPLPDMVPDVVQEPIYTRTDAGGGLLGDDPLAVALVGSSYSAESPENVWHFAGALSRELHSEILNAALPGQGPFAPMRAYLHSPERQGNPPRVVVWEIPERFLRVKSSAAAP